MADLYLFENHYNRHRQYPMDDFAMDVPIDTRQLRPDPFTDYPELPRRPPMFRDYPELPRRPPMFRDYPEPQRQHPIIIDYAEPRRPPPLFEDFVEPQRPPPLFEDFAEPRRPPPLLGDYVPRPNPLLRDYSERQMLSLAYEDQRTDGNEELWRNMRMSLANVEQNEKWFFGHRNTVRNHIAPNKQRLAAAPKPIASNKQTPAAAPKHQMPYAAKNQDPSTSQKGPGKGSKPRKYTNRFDKPRPAINEEDKRIGHFHLEVRSLQVMKNYLNTICETHDDVTELCRDQARFQYYFTLKNFAYAKRHSAKKSRSEVIGGTQHWCHICDEYFASDAAFQCHLCTNMHDELNALFETLEKVGKEWFSAKTVTDYKFSKYAIKAELEGIDVDTGANQSSASTPTPLNDNIFIGIDINNLSQNEFVLATYDNIMECHWPRAQTEFFCRTCNYISFGTKQELEGHNKTGKHLECEKSYKDAWCVSCQLHCTNAEGLERHKESSRHSMIKKLLADTRVKAMEFWNKAQSKEHLKTQDPHKTKKSLDLAIHPASGFICRVCDIKLSGQTDVDAHLLSKRHYIRLQGDVPQQNRDKPVLPMLGFTCRVCDIRLSGEIDVEAHTKSERHRQNLYAQYPHLAGNQGQMVNKNFQDRSNFGPHSGGPHNPQSRFDPANLRSNKPRGISTRGRPGLKRPASGFPDARMSRYPGNHNSGPFWAFSQGVSLHPPPFGQMPPPKKKPKEYLTSGKRKLTNNKLRRDKERMTMFNRNRNKKTW